MPPALLDDLSPLLAHAGSAWYFIPETLAAGRAVGLDGLRFYFLGRGGVLGDTDWEVVSAAFGYFAPALVEKMWTTGVQRCPVEQALAAHLAACADFGRRHAAPDEQLGPYCDAAEALIAAAQGDLGGLTLFAGYAAQPLPPDLPARAMQLTAALRELRGSAHLVAVVASGLPTRVAHAMRRPEMVAWFGWADGQIPAPSDDDRRRLAEADRTTDQILARHYATLDTAAADALLAGARAITAALPVPAG